MVRELGELIEEFPGLANMVRCFAHTVALGARSLMRQFDAPKGKPDGTLSEDEQLLKDLMEGMENLQYDDEEDNDIADWLEEDEDEELRDAREDLTAAAQEDLDTSLMPARMVMAKVSQTFASLYSNQRLT